LAIIIARRRAAEDDDLQIKDETPIFLVE